MLILKELEKTEIAEVYNTFMVEDFPDDERKPLFVILNNLEKNRYMCYGLFDTADFSENANDNFLNDIKGYAFLAYLKNESGTDYLVDYLAVKKEFRNQGFGSALLRLLTDSLPDCTRIIVETEDPSYAETEDEKEIRNQRIRFYLNNGFSDTKARVWLFYVDYRLLEYKKDGTPSSKKDAGTAYERILNYIVPGNSLKDMMKFHYPLFTPE